MMVSLSTRLSRQCQTPLELFVLNTQVSLESNIYTQLFPKSDLHAAGEQELNHNWIIAL